MPGPSGFNKFQFSTSRHKTNTRFHFFINMANYYKCLYAPFNNTLESEMTDPQKMEWLEKQVGHFKFTAAEFTKGHMPQNIREQVVTDTIELITDWAKKAAEKDTVLQPASAQMINILEQLSAEIKAETAPQQNPSTPPSRVSQSVGY